EKIDALISAHTHSLVDTYVRGFPVVQARSGGQAVAVVDIPLSTDGRPSGQAVAEIRPVSVAETAAHQGVDSIVRRATARVAAIVRRRYGTLAVTLTRTGSQYPLGNLVADAQRWAAKGDIAIMNNHGIRTSLPAGDVTYGTLYEVQPFANTLYSLRMTGAQVRQYLEKLLGGDEIPVHVSGITIGYNPDKPKGERILSLRLPEGRTLVDDAIYNVIVNNFMGTGGSNMGPPEGTHITPLDIVDLDALTGYVRTLPSPIAPPTENRIFIAQ
ncbi:MAG TPA: 5'-nucleotidase C-terminal domain-containing protein, partial [Gemmatimonadaceae bacterium]|nr:5'-nucleotidase C-terminal domain-containing protein [Gemmatimonadaceae bacterium]